MTPDRRGGEPAPRRRTLLPPAARPRPVSALQTEFGRVLETIMAVPGVVAVVFSDDGGYAIDYVMDDRCIAAIDVQIMGAQLGQPMQQLAACADRHRLGGSVVVVEGRARRLMCTTVARDYVLAAMLTDPANLAMAMRRLEAARLRLCALLAG